MICWQCFSSRMSPGTNTTLLPAFSAQSRVSSASSSCLSPVFLHNLNLRVKDQAYAMVEPNTSKALPTDDLKSKSILSEYLEILRILKEENFNKTRAADRLQITRKTLYNKLKTFNSLYTGMEN